VLPYHTNIFLRAFSAYWADGPRGKGRWINHNELRNIYVKYLIHAPLQGDVGLIAYLIHLGVW